MLYGVLPSHITEFGLTAGIGAGLILSVNRWIRLLSNSWAAAVYNRFGIRLPLLLSIGLAIGTTAAYSLFHGFWPLLIARIFWGICFSVQLISLHMVVLRESPDHRGRLMGLYNAIFRSGSLVAVLVGGLLVDILGIDVAFLIVAAAMLACIPIVSLISEDEHHSVVEQTKDRVNSRFSLWPMILGTNDGDIVLKRKILSVNYTRFTHTFAVSGLVTATLGLLLKERIIFLGTDVNPMISNIIVAQLLYLSREDQEKDINLYINSPGGSVYSGLSIYDTMQMIPNDICTYSVGLSASMGTILLTAGTKGKRYALPHSTMMMHSASGGAGGTVSDIQIQAKEILRVNDELTKIMAKHTGQSEARIRKDEDRDFWMDAKQAVEYGLVDEVISPTKLKDKK